MAEELLVPPSWDDVEKDQEYQKLTPPQKAETLTNWAKAVRTYGDQTGAWDDPVNQADFMDSTRLKFNEIQGQNKPVDAIEAGAYEDAKLPDWMRSFIPDSWEPSIDRVRQESVRFQDRVNLGVQQFAPQVFGTLDQASSLVTRIPELATEPIDFLAGTDLTKKYQELNTIGQYYAKEAMREQKVSEDIQRAGEALGGGPEIPYVGSPGDLAQMAVPSTLQAFLDIGLSGGSSAAGRALQAPAKGFVENIIRNATNPAVQRTAAYAGTQQGLQRLNQEAAQRMEQGETLFDAQGNSIPESALVGFSTYLFTALGGMSGAESVLEKSGVTGLKNRIKESLSEGFPEMAEEVADQYGQGVASFISEELDPSVKKEGSMAQRFVSKFDTKELVQAGILGYGIGSLTTGIGQAYEAATDTPENRVIVEQAAVQSENLRASGAPATADAIESIAATEIVQNAPEARITEALDELTAGEDIFAPEQGDERFAPPAISDETTPTTPLQQEGTQASPERDIVPPNEEVGAPPEDQARPIVTQQLEPIVPTEAESSGPLSQGQENNISLGNLERVRQGLPLSAPSQADLIMQGYATMEGGNLVVTPQGEQLLQAQQSESNVTPATQPIPSQREGASATTQAPTTASEGTPQETQINEPAPPPPQTVVETQATIGTGDTQPAAGTAPRRIQLKGTPQTFTVEEEIEPTPQEAQLGEMYLRVRNERTGETQVIEQSDIAREVRPKSERVKNAIQKLPTNQRAKAEVATEPSTEPDPYQGVPLSSDAPLSLEENIPFIQELSQYGAFDDDASGSKLLESIVNDKSAPEWEKTLARRLLSLNLPEITVEVQDRADSTWAALKAGNRIIFNLRRRNTGVAAAALHEVAHVATLDLLRNPGSLTEAQRKAYDELQGILSEIQGMPEFQGEYGITSLEEMVAESFSNAGFRAKLQNLSPNQPPSSLWRRFIRAIGRLLTGQSVQSGSALERAIEAALTLANAPIVEVPSNGTAAMAEPVSWGDVLSNNSNASNEAMAKAYEEGRQQLEAPTEIAQQEITPLTPEQQGYITSLDDPMRLVKAVAARFANIPGATFEDRQDEAIQGLVKAAKTFNPEIGTFGGWATRVMTQQLISFRNREIRRLQSFQSGNQPILEDDSFEDIISLTPSPEDLTVQENDLLQLRLKAGEALVAAINSLPERDQAILRDYASGLSLREVGKRNNITSEGARKIIFRSRNAIEDALFLRDIDINEILTEPQERYGVAESTRAQLPEDEQAFTESAVGRLEGNDLAQREAVSRETAGDVSDVEEGFGGPSQQIEGAMDLAYGSSPGDGPTPSDQPLPLDQALQQAVQERPELHPAISEFSNLLSRLGASLNAWNGGFFKAGLLGESGQLAVFLDPRVIATQDVQYIESALEEEAIHLLDIAAQVPEFLATGLPADQFPAWQMQQAQEIIEEFHAISSSLPESEKQSVDSAMVAAYNTYHQEEEASSVEDLMAQLRANQEFNQTNFDSPRVFDFNNYLREFARMVIQERRSGRITEETSTTILAKIGEWIRRGLEAIQRVSQLLREGEVLSGTKFSQLVDDIEALANENFARRQYLPAPPRTFTPPSETTGSDDASVAPMSPRGRETRTPILPPDLREKISKTTEGPYRPQGMFSAAGKWSQSLYDLLKQKNQNTRAALSRVEFIGNKLNRQLNDIYVREGLPVPTEQINTALGNTDNRLTPLQAEVANSITDDAERESFILTAKMENLENFKRRQEAALLGLPIQIQETISEMRVLIDDLSKRMIAEGDISDDMRFAIDSNIGTYLHRSYQIFDGDHWNDFIRSDDPEATSIRQRAEALFRDYIYAQKAAEYARSVRASGGRISRSDALRAVKGLDVSKEVETMLNDYLAIADGSVVDTLRGRLPGQKNQSIIKLRGDIPKEIRDLWGQQDDASVNFGRTYASIATYLENQKFLNGVLEDGLRNGYLWKEGVSPGIRPSNYVEIVGGEGAKSLAPLAGVYGPPTLRDAFSEAYSPQVQDWLGTLTMAAMKAKTVYSIGSIVRNFFGNPAFMLANGNLFLGDLGNSAKLTMANFRKLAPKEQRERIARYTELGVLGENVGPNILKELSEGSRKVSEADTPFKAILQWTGDKLSSVREGFEGAYSGVDDFWKIYAFESELAKQKWIDPSLPLQEQEQKAAQIVRNTVPTYSESPAVVRDLLKGKLGKFVAPFITFTTEVMRVTGGTVAQTARELKSSNPRERAVGASRLAGMIAVSAIPAILSHASKALFGYDDEDEEALRSGLPDWQKNATILFLPRDSQGNIRFIDLSYLNPYNYFTDAAKAVARSIDRGDSADQVAVESLKGAAKQLLDPFLAEQIAIGAYVDITRNQKANGAEVYNPQDTVGVKAQKIATRILQSFTPGTIDSATRVWKAGTGYIEPTGRAYDLGNEIMAPLLGQRISSYNPKQGLQFQSSRFNGERQDAGQIFNKTFTSQGTVEPGQVQDAYRRTNEARYRIYQDLRNNYMGALALGVDRNTAVQTMKAKNVGNDTIAQVVSGQYVKYRPSDAALRDVAAQFPERLAEFMEIYRETPSVTPLR